MIAQTQTSPAEVFLSGADCMIHNNDSRTGAFYETTLAPVRAMMVMPTMVVAGVSNRDDHLCISRRTDRSQREQHTQGKDPTCHANFQGLSPSTCNS
jgi:hypothetical protein